MKKLLVLASLFSMAFITSCNKANDEIEVTNQAKITKTENYCKNVDNALFKTYYNVENKDKATIIADLNNELELLSKMNAEFRKDDNNKNKVLYLKSEASIVSSDGTVQEMLISIHISDNPSDPVPQTTRTIYTGTKAGAYHKKAEIYWQNVLQHDPCAPYSVFEWNGVWYLEDCC